MNIENLSFTTEYNVASCLGDVDVNRFCQEINGNLIARNYEDETEQTIIGKLTGFKILLDEGVNNDWNAYDIFDAQRTIFSIAEIIYDFETDSWNKKIEKFYDNNIVENDLLILDRIEILPAYKGFGIGKRWIKDFYMNFSQEVSLFVLKAFPLQLEADAALGQNMEWREKMNYSNDEQNEKKANAKLLNYYKSIGFQLIPKLSKDILFINPCLSNKKLDKIVFDL